MISKEFHQDGNLFMHVYFEFENQQQIHSRDKLHVTAVDQDSNKLIVQESKYEGVRNKVRILEYVIKHIKLGSKINIQIFMVDNIIYWNMEKHLYVIIESKGFKEACRILVTEYKIWAVK